MSSGCLPIIKLFAVVVVLAGYVWGRPLTSLLNNFERDTDLQPQDVNIDPYPGKPRVTFRPDGTFKITIFSDLHFGENPWDAWGPEQDVNSTRLMRTVLSDEKPDYVSVYPVLTFSKAILTSMYRVINGDLITGESALADVQGA